MPSADEQNAKPQAKINFSEGKPRNVNRKLHSMRKELRELALVRTSSVQEWWCSNILQKTGPAIEANAALKSQLTLDTVPSQDSTATVSNVAMRHQQWKQHTLLNYGAAASSASDEDGDIANRPTQVDRYCVHQCGFKKCCDDGWRTLKHFEIVSDTRVGDTDVDSVTLVSQGTLSRLKHTATGLQERWPGPKVIVVVVFNHTTWASDHQLVADEIIQLRQLAPSLNNTVVALYVVTHRGNPKLPHTWDIYSRSMPLEASLMRASGGQNPVTLYPINTLRNVAVDLAVTNWVFPVDLDFLPSATLHKRLKQVYLPKITKVGELYSETIPFGTSLNDNLHVFMHFLQLAR
jgi:hypothetical protein